jgi:hypothetical protein
VYARVRASVGGASPRVKGFLLLLLGDAFAHEGKAGLARSWWTLAGESTDDRGAGIEIAQRLAERDLLGIDDAGLEQVGRAGRSGAGMSTTSTGRSL